MAHKTGELKKRCWLAKQRLKMGYWESLKQEKEQNELGGNAITFAADRIAKYKLNAEIAVSRAPAQDDKMYRKVCDILDSDEVATNPIGQLIDRDVYDALDAAAKQRYVLELSDKFRELKERYYREKTGA